MPGPLDPNSLHRQCFWFITSSGVGPTSSLHALFSSYKVINLDCEYVYIVHDDKSSNPGRMTMKTEHPLPSPSNTASLFCIFPHLSCTLISGASYQNFSSSHHYDKLQRLNSWYVQELGSPLL